MSLRERSPLDIQSESGHQARDLPTTVRRIEGEDTFLPWRPSGRLRLLLLCNFTVAAAYVTWWLAPGRMGTPVLFYLLAAAEAFNLAHHIGLWWAMWAGRGNPPPPARTAFSIDVLIPTHGEPTELLERTIAAAVAMDLPHRTLVLDDAWRPEVKVLAESLGADYLARWRSEKGGAKAGNLNVGLSATSGDLLAIFDADHVPRKDFLRRIVGYFEDPSVAFVQTPQYYGNGRTDAVARKAFQQQAIFYGPICRGKNGLSAAFCCGTNVLFRRAALEDVGGFDERSVVEDFVTSMKIHRRGWTSVYYPYVLAEGMGPSSIGRYFRQQFRWARGSIGALFSLEPFKPGFTIGQRVQYLLATTFYLTGIVTAIYVCLPILHFLGGWSTFSPRGATFMFFYAPYLIVALFTIRRGLGGRLRLEHVQYTFGSFPVYAAAALAALLHLPARFRVTKKTTQEERTLPPLLAWVSVAAFAATVVALVVGVVTKPLEPRTVTNLSWGVMNLLLLSAIAGATVRELVGRRAPTLAPLRLDAPLVASGALPDGSAPFGNGSGNGREGRHRRSRLRAALRRPALTSGDGHSVLTDERRLVLPEHALSAPEVLPRPSRRLRSRLPLAVLGLTLAGLAVRLLFIDAQSLRLDEATTLYWASQPVADIWRGLAQASVETHPPLLHTILHFWIGVAGTSEWALRLPSVILGAAAIPLLYLVARRLIGERGALLATAVGAVAPFWVWHSDEARMYPLMLVLALASMLLLFHAVERGGLGRWAAYAVVTGVSLYTHYFALLMPLVHLAYLLIHRVPRRKVLAWFGAMAGVAVVFLPWIALVASRLQPDRFDAVTNFLRESPISYTPFGLVSGLAIFFSIFLIGYQPAGKMAEIGLVIGFWPLLVLLGMLSRRFIGWLRSRTAAFLFAWVGIVVGTALLGSTWKGGFWLHRYMYLASPPLFLLVGLAASRIRRTAVALTLVLATFTTLTVINNLSLENPGRDDLRAAADIVGPNARPGEPVVLFPGYFIGPFIYYYEHDEVVVGLSTPAQVLDPVRALDGVRTITDARRGGTFWIVIRHLEEPWVGATATNRLPRLLDRAYRLIEAERFGNVDVRHYRIPIGSR